MLPENSQKKCFDELAIANFNSFQIVVPTIAKPTKKKVFSGWITVPKREYASHGWFIYEQTIAALIQGIHPGPVESTHSPKGKSPSILKRISAAIPLSFQTEGSHPLPTTALSAAAFAYHCAEEPLPHRAVFHQMAPRFVRIYPFLGHHEILSSTQQMLSDEHQFIAENYEHLKHIPFYQEQFALKPVDH